jgi:thiosulfate/3-mercaptopyruvate sulfurtransferase
MSSDNYKASPLIQPQELGLYLSAKNCVIIDCRQKSHYVAQHLKGAIQIDLDTQLAHVAENAANGGRHPLPSINSFVKLLGQLGISESSSIFIYDNHSGANYAARLWWMLRGVGHQNVRVINGGLNSILSANLPTSSGEGIVRPATQYACNHQEWQMPLATINELDHIVTTQSAVIVDVRDSNRYLGINEPIDLLAGHIPTAINIPFSDNLDKEGYFLSEDELHQKYSFLSHTSIIHCGSGVTACHTILAMAYARLAIPKLYVGSWSEWSRTNRTIINSGQ